MMYQDQGYDRAMMQDMKDSWDAMNERMDALESRHDDMMREAMNPVAPAEEATLVQPAIPGSNGQYSGYRVIDGQTINYSLRSREGAITGALIGTDAE